MANIAVHKEPQTKPTRPEREWDPFRTMRDVLRWDPFGEIAPRWFGEDLGFNAAFEVKESKDAFVFKADLPGIKAEDLDVKLTQNRLTISGKREAEKTEKGDTFYTFERSYGSFVRSFTLPEGVDGEKIEADLKDGVLNVKLPKKPEAQPKQVSVKSK
ncbi:MAG: Hsp20/alpha crystallin family protein [Myxococcales bacterium]|nr:Hsp20/alpha crystallin family protein [Myxococcales bacterium]